MKKTTPLLLSMLCAFYAQAADLSPFQKQGGLAVISGSNSAEHAMSLAKDGRWLVRIVAKHEAEANKLRSETESLVGLVTVRTAAEDGRLPLHTDTVNLVVLDKGSQISMEEARRVLAPEAVLMNNGKREEMPENSDYAPWTHLKGDAQGTGVSKDKLVAPSNSLRWLAQDRLTTELRSTNGVVATLGMTTLGERSATISGRDVYSGVALWSNEPIMNRYQQYFFVSHELGFIHAQEGEMNPVVLRDAGTGEIIRSFDEGLSLPVKWGDKKMHFGPPTGSRFDKDTGNGQLRVWGDTLIQVYGFDVVALDIPTGKKLWQTRLEKPSARVVLSQDGSRLWVQETTEPRQGHGRWGDFPTAALTALSMKDGKTLWRKDWSESETLVKGKRVTGAPRFTELFDVDGTLYIWDGTANLHRDWHGDMWGINPKTGETLWHLEDANNKTQRKEYGKHGPMTNNGILWNGMLVSKHATYSLTPQQSGTPGFTFVEESGGTQRFTGAENGKTRSKLTFLGGNQRCVRMSGTEDWIVYGFNSFVSKDGTSYQTSLVRGNCAKPNYATYGAVMSLFDPTCSCYNGLRGSIALIPAVEVKPIPESDRLVVPAARKAAAHQDLPDSALVRDMIQYEAVRSYFDQERIPPTKRGNIYLSVDVQRHLVTATSDEAGAKVLWTYRADGRIYSTPNAENGLAYVTTTAGTVTCLDLKTGKATWRFLAAPTRQELVANGQLESRWPVYNSVLKDGTVYVVAGRHVEADSGAWFWALDAESGAVKQRFHSYLPMVKWSPGDNTYAVNFRGNRGLASNSALITGLVLDEEGQVCLMNRKWNKSGSRASGLGYWRSKMERTSDRKDAGAIDPTVPNGIQLPLDFTAWDGKTVDPNEKFQPELVKKIKRGGYQSPLKSMGSPSQTP